MAEPIRVREMTNEEANRLLRIVRRTSGSVVTWRRAQMVLLSAQGMDPAQIARWSLSNLAEHLVEKEVVARPPQRARP